MRMRDWSSDVCSSDLCRTIVTPCPSSFHNALHRGSVTLCRASAAPRDFQPQGSSLCRTTPWRSLELVKHHRALGLATAPLDVTCGIDIANGSPAPPVTLVRPHAPARAARLLVRKDRTSVV